jgi:tetratricopeptide (TPR) repeat protein
MRIKFFVVIAAAILATNTYADDATEKARQHYQRATSLYDVGRFADAASEYEAAYQIKNDPALLFNLGQAYRYAGEYNKAIFAYRGYLRRVPEAENRSEVEGYIAKAQQALQHQSEPSSVETKQQVSSEPTVSAAPLATSTSQLTATAAPPAPPKTPAYKKWWVWTIVGVVAAGAAAGVAVGVTSTGKSSSTPLFPAVGGSQ